MILNIIQTYGHWLPMILTAVLIPFITAPIGCMILWQRKAFLGETLSHAALAGVALGLLLKVDPLWGILAVGMGITWILSRLDHGQTLPKDALLAMIAQGGLALGLLVISQLKDQRIDISAYLFGDLLTVSWKDVFITAGMMLGLGVFMILKFRSILAYIIHEELARVEALMSPRLPLQLSALMTLSIAILLPMVGALLLTALMVIPGATARTLSATPKAMIGIALMVSLGTMMGGFWLSFVMNWPTSATMVLVGLGLFLLGRMYGVLIRK